MAHTSSSQSRPRRRPEHEIPTVNAEVELVNEAQERLLDRLASGAHLCRKLERRLRDCPSPEVSSIIELHRCLVLQLSFEAESDPDLFRLVSILMRPVLEYARIEELRKRREFAEQKFREQQAAQHAGKSERSDALRPETLDRIERELHLF